MLILFTESSRVLRGRAGSWGGAEGGPGSILLSRPRSRSTAPLVVLTAQKVCSSQTHPLGQLQPHPKAHEFFPCRGAVAGPSTRTLVQDKLVVATTVVPSTRLSLGPLRGDTGAWSPNMHQLPLGLQPEAEYQGTFWRPKEVTGHRQPPWLPRQPLYSSRFPSAVHQTGKSLYCTLSSTLTPQFWLGIGTSYVAGPHKASVCINGQR